MATYGKTLREEVKTPDGADEDFALGAERSQVGGEELAKRPWLADLVLVVSLLLFFTGNWIAALIAFAVHVGIMVCTSTNERFESAGADLLARKNENGGAGDHPSADNSWR